MAIALPLTVAAHELLVRRTRVTRFLFGMRAWTPRRRSPRRLPEPRT
ncbi:hypothetical protein [Streptomyces sp. NPDC090994]